MSMPQSPEEMKAFNRQLVADFRAHDPKLSGRKILLLTTTGARSEAPHTTPMTYVRDGDHVLVIASNAGATRHPDWYFNLVAHPTVTVELADETYQARARTAEGEERARLWASIIAQMPFFADHQARVSRQIPVVILERIE